MHAIPMSTTDQEKNVLDLTLVPRGVVTADRKRRCKQIYSYLEGLYCISVKISGNFRDIKISGNFQKYWNEFPEISGLTTLTETTY